ncbi:PAS domain S-box protein [Paenibacillus albicereus]|uniref:Circadian input-output histidine kinase CikA n=1 Tax=Paenibacillus albicereus TaxID=2726185 RepID=A0A6H2GWK3_9BACL|nr:PAS domain-containing hybrid sensor histidine kinase/response regulator [Paenibacillus albicereus]QJC51739.1 PAS domain S-box protein [Paenibacillus albicereus]
MDNFAAQRSGAEEERTPRQPGRAMLASVISRSPNPLLLFDSGFRIIMVNPAFLRAFDCTAEELAGFGADAFARRCFPADSVCKAELARIRDREPIDCEEELTVAGGERRTFRVIGYELEGEAGSGGGYLLSLEDVSERKRFELQLQESVERYTSLKKYNHDAVISLDLQGRVINFNQEAARLLGKPAEELAGKDFSPYLLVEESGGTAEIGPILRQASEDTAAERKFTGMRHSGGRITEILASIAPIIINGTTKGYYLIAKDMSVQKKLLIDKEAAEATNRAKNEFLSMMSHEIRNPMNGILGLTRMMLDTPLEGEARQYIELIRKSSHALLHIVNDTLDYTRLESEGTERAVERPFRLDELLDEIIAIHMPIIVQKELRLETSIAKDMPAELLGDRGKLGQVLLNLIGNAVKFTDRGDIRVAFTLKEGAGASLLVEGEVSDTGVGITEFEQQQLFHPFRRIGAYMTRTEEGSGLGLAISRRLVELMGGAIEVESTPGQGSRFRFRFAAKAVEARPSSGQAEPSPESDGPLRVLVGEDNEINQLVIRKMLEKSGHAVRVVSNGAEVLEALQEEGPYDLLLLDILMPVLGGFETMAAMQKMKLEQPPYVVAVTANALRGDREACLEAGMDDYLSKPIRRDKLEEALAAFRISAKARPSRS